MRNNADNARDGKGNTVRLSLPAAADNSDLSSLLNPLLENQQYRICLDVSRVSHWGTVELRVLGIFAESCRRQGGFLKLENASATVAARVREFGFTDLIKVASV